MMKPFDFSKKRRMGKAAFVILFLKNSRQFVWSLLPLVFVFFFQKDSLLILLYRFLLILSILFVFALLISLIRYFTISFEVKEGFIYIYEGLFFKRQTSIPINKIHNIRTKSGLFYQLTDMEGLEFDTVGEEGAEVELILTKEESMAMRELISSMEEAPEPSGYEEKSAEDLPQEEKNESSDHEVRVKYGIGQLLLGAYTQNPLRAFLLIGSFLGFSYQYFDDYMLQHSDVILHETQTFVATKSLGALSLIVLFAYLVSLFLYGGSIVIRQYGLTLNLHRKGLEYSAGLLTVVRQTIRHNRVIFLSIKQNPLEKLVGLCSVYFEQASKVSGNEKKKEASIILYGWRDYKPLLHWWVGADTIAETDKADVSSKLALARRIFLMWVLPISLISMVGAYYWTLNLLWFTAVWTIIGLLQAVMTYRHSGISVDGDYLIIHGGRWAVRRMFLPIQKVEQVEYCQSFWQRRAGTVSLRFRTMGEMLTIPYIPEKEANWIRNIILQKIESKSANKCAGTTGL